MYLLKLITLLAFLLASSIQAQEININTASAQQIASSLKGIGIKKAEEIVRYRNQHGKFKNANDLTKIKGIGKKTVTKNEINIRFK
ncbi:MAG: helix-hairpin-helix domain-containing protein [Gammaproteobacteria bacterium]|nr:helix-hairpin-helix domain-containing protein [Gammaproteobacteria bacterium]